MEKAENRSMKRVLILTYYWPPAGGAGVQRWLKFSKYLRQYGWDPVIYTSEDGEYPALDPTLNKDVPQGITVLKTKPWEPYGFYKKLIGGKKGEKVAAGFISEDKKPGLVQRLAIWIRGNLFIPDARKFWIRPSVNYLAGWLKNNRVDAIISTGPPHTMHCIALRLKKKFKLPWIADFRDPWTKIDFYDQLMLSQQADAKHKRMERAVIKNCDKLVTVSPSWANDFLELGAREVEVITNGFDEADFDIEKPEVIREFAFHHIGALNQDRNPHNFWLALKEALMEEPEIAQFLKVRLIGKTDFSALESARKAGLEKYLEKVPYMPHGEIITFLMRSPILLLPLNDTPNTLGIIPGKLFEYLAAGRPIFCIGHPKGDSARIIQDCEAGMVFGFHEKDKMKEGTLALFREFRSGNFQVKGKEIMNYSRQKGAEKFASLLNHLTYSG
jgi:hypothetical protein